MQMTGDGQIHCLEVIIALIKKVLGDSPALNAMKVSVFFGEMLLLFKITEDRVTQVCSKKLNLLAANGEGAWRDNL